MRPQGPGDATQADVIEPAVAGTDAVICTIGTSFTRKPVDVYSASSRLVVVAMRRHGRQRLLVVASSGVNPAHGRAGSRRYFGRTVYDDMEQMEPVVSASGLDWTVVRPPGLTDEPGTGYAVAENDIDGGLCTREDLAAMLPAGRRRTTG